MVGHEKTSGAHGIISDRPDKTGGTRHQQSNWHLVASV